MIGHRAHLRDVITFMPVVELITHVTHRSMLHFAVA